jgi:hypothetical protein
MLSHYNVRCALHGDFEESGLICSFFIRCGDLNSAAILKVFPFEGIFHFRVMVKDPERGSFSWVDLTDSTEIDYEIKSRCGEEILELQGLILSLPNDEISSDIEINQYLKAVSQELRFEEQNRFNIS